MSRFGFSIMSRLGHNKALTVTAAILFVALVLVGCASRPEAAQKLFDRGQYQLVIEKYPDLEIARRAKAKMAEKLLEQKDYETILRDYSDTPSVFKAKQGIAQKLFDAGQYQQVIDQYPTLPVAKVAKERMADSLYAAGRIDEVIARFADTQRGQTVKEEKAAQLLTEAKKLRGQKRTEALTNIVTNYGSTKAFTEANDLLTKIRLAAAKPGKPKK
jgi:hypothetical protein